MEIYKLCRLCANTLGESSYNVFSKNNDQQIVQAINQFIPVVIYRTDPLSKEICEKCYKTLELFSSFEKQCLNVQDTFKVNLQKRSYENNIKLYLDALANENQLRFKGLVSLSPLKDPSDIQRTSSAFSNREKSSITVLTPRKINQLNLDNNIVLRRRCGPKSKVKRCYNPLTLLQSALQTVNINIDVCIGRVMKTKTSVRESNEKVSCKYCMESFQDIKQLSQHEPNHMSVVVGPKIDEPPHFGHYYLDYKNRNEQHAAVNVKRKRPISRMKYNIKVPSADDSLLEPDVLDTEPFSIANDEICLNGIPLKDIAKEERRMYFKSIEVNGQKRKFCPLCRHTFKDNWSIEHHYLMKTCLYNCPYCGMKFKMQKHMFPGHLQMHKGEKCNKVFGMTVGKKVYSQIKKTNLTKEKSVNIYNSNFESGINKRDSEKKILEKKRMDKNLEDLQKVDLKSDIESPEMVDPKMSQDSVTLQLKNKLWLHHQAYFCRKCYKIFYKIEQYNTHVNSCYSDSNDPEKDLPRIQTVTSQAEEHNLKENKTELMRESTKERKKKEVEKKRPVRSCVRDLNILEYESEPEDDYQPQMKKIKRTEQGFDCTMCCSSFPTAQSRNSHMRIHKSQLTSQPTVDTTVTVTPSVSIPKTEPKVKATSSVKSYQNDLRLANLNPTVAKLVQNNPHLTIRSYTKVEDKPVEVQEKQHRYFRCGDCLEKFINKSVLYHHKMNYCVVKRNYECAFCHKKFGAQEQYNMHMLYVHPE